MWDINGIFKKNKNFAKEDAENNSFTGSKINSCLNDLALGMQDSLDTYGRNNIKSNINMNGFRLSNASKGDTDNDYVTLGQLISNGRTSLEVKLDNYELNPEITFYCSSLQKIDIEDLKAQGFRFVFTMPELYNMKVMNSPYTRLEQIVINIDGTLIVCMAKNTNTSGSPDRSFSFFWDSLESKGIPTKLNATYNASENIFLLSVDDNNAIGTQIFVFSGLLYYSPAPAGYAIQVYRPPSDELNITEGMGGTGTWIKKEY